MAKLCNKSKSKCIELPLDWEKVKCRVGGRRLRTACNTVLLGDRAAFRAGKLKYGQISERADDILAAWGIKYTKTAVQEVNDRAGITVEDLANMHLSNVVPNCLEYEAGRHTCHPEEPPGIEFYNLAREQFRSDVRAGKFKWRRTPRGGDGGEMPGNPFDEPPGAGSDARPQQAGMSGGMLAVAAVAAFLLFK